MTAARYASELEAVPAGSPAELVYLAPSHLRQGQIHETRREHEKAVVHYRRFLDLWRESDPALRASVSEAKSSLARLTGGAR